MNVVDRFLKYVSFDTEAKEGTGTTPSTPGQLVLAAELVKELEAIGLEEISLDENGYVMATLPANNDDDATPTIGFIAHMDTSPDMSGRDVKPRIVQYEGGDIVLNEEHKVILSPSQFPELEDYVGQELIVTDGTTLLGADDKAGIAAIVGAVAYLKEHPEIKHGKIRIGFTPDEEIGQGADHFDVAKFGCDLAYTIDGGQIGELEYENFNAAIAKIIFKGRNVHPGYAKNKMINACHLATEFDAWMPSEEKPEHTEKYEGFFHLVGMSGTVEEASLTYIIRDHDRTLFAERKMTIKDLVKDMNEKFEGCASAEIRDQYFNMREIVEPRKEIINFAHDAMLQVGVEPLIKPIRGGTDGSRLSFMGLPCPNIFAGGHNFHGRYEFIPIPSLKKAMETIVKIAELVNKKD
ncbi:MAG: peptidase T [Tannerellaceae bacterium]